MKKNTMMIAIMSGFMIMTFVAFKSQAMAAVTANELVIADFNTGEKPSNSGGDFGAWNKDPDDDTQKTEMKFVTDDALGDSAGYSIRLDYDVDSPNPAYNGFWMKLKGVNATPYDSLTFYVKGDSKTGFTKRLKIELKDKGNKPSAYLVANITDTWQKISIPFDRFRRIQDWTSLSELVVVFDDMNSNPKTGAIYVDQITLSKE